MKQEKVYNIKQTYLGIEIGYDEKENRWDFELRGRERHSESLTKAKEAIDAPMPEGKKAFKRIAAFMFPHDGGYYSSSKKEFTPCQITSIADSNYGYELWVVSGAGYKERSKRRADSVVLDTPGNVKLIQEWLKLDQQMQQVIKDKEMIAKAMVHVNPKDYE
jgi:hypothetical protein